MTVDQIQKWLAKTKAPAGGRTALQGCCCRTAGAEHPTTIYVGCGAHLKQLSLILLRFVIKSHPRFRYASMDEKSFYKVLSTFWCCDMDEVATRCEGTGAGKYASQLLNTGCAS